MLLLLTLLLLLLPLLLLLQALLLHNQVLKHACYDNIGYVLEQEGDSFTVAFHEPQDAVAFALQVGYDAYLWLGIGLLTPWLLKDVVQFAKLVKAVDCFTLWRCSWL